MSTMDIFKSDDYTGGLTKQSFKDSTDINKILAKAAKGDTISHLAKHGAIYGDFSDIDDLLVAHSQLKKGQKIFEELPAEIKREFNQSPQEFYNFVNDPNNQEKLADVLPSLAAPGNQQINVRRSLENQGGTPTEAQNSSEVPTEPPAA